LFLSTLVNQFGRSHELLGFLECVLPPSSVAVLGAFTFLDESSKKGDMYNMLWALVFGFATLNILSLVAKRFDPDRNRMSFGEIMAVLTVVVSVILLGWEMLYMFKILPIRLPAH
jgi:branched-subunit amino acid transport protein AzlD